MSEDDTWDKLYDDGGHALLVEHQVQGLEKPLTQGLEKPLTHGQPETALQTVEKKEITSQQYIFNSTVKKIKFKKIPKTKVAATTTTTTKLKKNGEDEDDDERNLFDDYDNYESNFDLKTGRNVRL